MTNTGSATLSSVIDHNDGTYSATMTNTIAEIVAISATFVGGSNVSNTVDVNFVYVSKTINFNGLDYKTLLSPDTGRIWLDRNLGAARVATSSRDSASYGHLYQWGRDDDGHERRTSATTTTLATDIANAGTSLFITNIGGDWASVDANGSGRKNAWADGGANGICPAGFGVPTEAELMADTINATTTNITNRATAFSSFLKLPVAGSRTEFGTLAFSGFKSRLWSRSLSHNDQSKYLHFELNGATFNSTNWVYGFSVRCINN